MKVIYHADPLTLYGPCSVTARTRPRSAIRKPTRIATTPPCKHCIREVRKSRGWVSGASHRDDPGDIAPVTPVIAFEEAAGIGGVLAGDAAAPGGDGGNGGLPGGGAAPLAAVVAAGAVPDVVAVIPAVIVGAPLGGVELEDRQ
jgi:hypothetical protein